MKVCAVAVAVVVAVAVAIALCVPILLMPLDAEAAPVARQAPTSASDHDADDVLEVNTLEMKVTNYGMLTHDAAGGGSGLLYPRGSGKSAIFAAGLWVGAVALESRRTAFAHAEYPSYPYHVWEYVPGPMAGGFYQPDLPEFRNYRIDRGDTTSHDYEHWPIAAGAPTDSLGKPLFLGDATLWSVYNEASTSSHLNYYGGGTAPLGIEIRQTTFAFDRPGPLGRTIFFKFEIVNRGYNQLDSMHVSLWCDTDIGGWLTDDLAGCDTMRSLAYGYNAPGSDEQHGLSAPAAGFTLLQGPIARREDGTADTLGMTALLSYSLDEGYQYGGAEVFNLMKGLRADGTPIHVFDDPGQPVTTFMVSGDPVAGTGWLDSNPGERRFLLSSGPFSMALGESQEIVAAIVVGSGGNHLASVADLPNVHAAAVEAWRSGFQVPEEPTTAIATHLIESEVLPDRVSLTWRVPDDPDVIGIVERREPGATWSDVSSTLFPVIRTIHFDDRAVTPGGRYGYRLLVRSDSEQDRSSELWVTIPATPVVPEALLLGPGFPNPTSGSSRWSIFLPREGGLRLAIWDAQGRLVRVVLEENRAPGWHEATWDGTDRSGREVATGIYFARLETAEGNVTGKVVVAR